MDTDKLPGYLRHLGRNIENRIADTLGGKDAADSGSGDDSGPLRFDAQGFEPDWDELDKKANLVVARYTAVGAAANVLPIGLDIVAVTAVFTKMTTELAGIYQVMMSNKRARQMSWAIATTTGTVLGAVVAGSKLASFIPGGYFVGVAVQAPLVGAVTWAAGDTLKDYFKQTRRGREPGVDALKESFAHTLRIRLKKVKIAPVASDEPAPAASAAAAAPAKAAFPKGKNVPAPPAPAAAPVAATSSVGDAIERIAGLHELMKAGIITQAEFDAKKTDLLSKL